MRLTEYSKNLLLIYILKGVPMDKKKEIRIFLAKRKLQVQVSQPSSSHMNSYS